MKPQSRRSTVSSVPYRIVPAAILWRTKRRYFSQKRFTVWNTTPCAGQVISQSKIPASAAGCAHGIVPFPPSRFGRNDRFGSRMNASCVLAVCTIVPNSQFSMANTQSSTGSINTQSTNKKAHRKENVFLDGLSVYLFRILPHSMPR